MKSEMTVGQKKKKTIAPFEFSSLSFIFLLFSGLSTLLISLSFLPSVFFDWFMLPTALLSSLGLPKSPRCLPSLPVLLCDILSEKSPPAVLVVSVLKFV